MDGYICNCGWVAKPEQLQEPPWDNCPKCSATLLASPNRTKQNSVLDDLLSALKPFYECAMNGKAITMGDMRHAMEIFEKYQNTTI
jgi:hypothetical protein